MDINGRSDKLEESQDAGIAPGSSLYGLRDSHLHLHDLEAHEHFQADGGLQARGWIGLSSCHSREEWEWHLERFGQDGAGGMVRLSLGIHPQLPRLDLLEFLEKTAVEAHPRLFAIGECGFDFFDSPDPAGPFGEAAQTKAFEAQLDLAIRTGLPLVIHLRKATDRIFRYTRELKKVRGVIFHAWPSASAEANAILARGINAWFSLGTPLIRGNKKTRDTLEKVPPDRILLETDGPYQTLRGQAFTSRAALLDVCKLAASIKGIAPRDMARISHNNFHRALDK